MNDWRIVAGFHSKSNYDKTAHVHSDESGNPGCSTPMSSILNLITIMEETHYKGLIDITNFGLVADYLTRLGSSIFFLIHVQKEEQLAKIAKEIDDHCLKNPSLDLLLPSSVQDRMAEGTLKVSSRFPQLFPNPYLRVNVSEVDRNAQCRIIYLEPFYVVHTAGLFEGSAYIKQRREQTRGPLAELKSELTEMVKKKNQHGHSQ